MVKSCDECGLLLSPHMPVREDAKLLICQECLRVVCSSCAKKNRGRCPNKKCKSKKLRELSMDELD